MSVILKDYFLKSNCYLIMLLIESQCREMKGKIKPVIKGEKSLSAG